MNNCIDCGVKMKSPKAKRCWSCWVPHAKDLPQLQKGAYRKPHPGISYRGYGWKHSEKTKNKMRMSAKNKWKGDLVGYRTLHLWVVRHLGKPSVCKQCGKIGAGRKMHWANISREYKRILGDWIRLCAKCHKNYDRKAVISYV